VCARARYNTDVAMVGPPQTPQAAKARAMSGLPPHQWVMILENAGGKYGQFALSAASDPTDYTQWEFTQFTMPPGFGACPSIRYDPATGYYYVLTGGNSISVLRSLDLQKWEVSGGVV
jgi:hypothetical protein